MKKLGIFILFISINLMAKAQSAAEKEVAVAVEQLRLAMISGERAALDHIAATDLSYGHSSGKLEDKAAFVESIASGKSDFVTIDFKNQTIKVTGKTALVRHQLDAKTNDGGKPGEVRLGILLVWQKQGKNWKLLGRQAYKLP
ncbi:nuclear transport factor 2 family protein [Pedobacter sp. UC225_65]|uniref:nuclear transport factor 2 family protein n=1 Tax=Pedobacter sp. UC225_65 TaxID=3350173 RepID=UPI0036732C2A